VRSGSGEVGSPPIASVECEGMVQGFLPGAESIDFRYDLRVVSIAPRAYTGS